VDFMFVNLFLCFFIGSREGTAGLNPILLTNADDYLRAEGKEPKNVPVPFHALMLYGVRKEGEGSVES